MRHKNLDLMEAIREFAERFYFDNGRSPSTTEVGKAVGVARGTAYRYLVEMDERGIIQYDGKNILSEKSSGYLPTVAQCFMMARFLVVRWNRLKHRPQSM